MTDIQLRAVRTILRVLGGRSLTAELRRTRGGVVSDSAALRDLCFGVFRHLGLLRRLITLLAIRPVRDLDVEALLLVALYQLEFTRAAPYAVVDHAAAACARLGKRSATGFVNALLRNFLRRTEALLVQARKTEEGRWSHPQWWIDHLKQAYPACFGTILDVGATHPPMTLRVNLRRMDCAEYLALLIGEGVHAQRVGPAAVMLANPMPVERLPGFDRGLVSVQDLSAQYAALLLDLVKGQRVLDACAAPGGKAAHVLETADVELLALDRDADRLAQAGATLERLGLRAHLVCADAGEPTSWWDSVPFHRILLDAPCTGSGIVRRHPDIKWLRRPQDTTALVQKQRRLLDALWHMLAAGGKLLYATCSVFPEENQLQIAAFLRSHPEARLLPLSDIPDGPEIGNINGQILPDSRHDGFFYALLQKV